FQGIAPDNARSQARPALALGRDRNASVRTSSASRPRAGRRRRSRPERKARWTAAAGAPRAVGRAGWEAGTRPNPLLHLWKTMPDTPGAASTLQQRTTRIVLHGCSGRAYCI